MTLVWNGPCKLVENLREETTWES